MPDTQNLFELGYAYVVVRQRIDLYVHMRTQHMHTLQNLFDSGYAPGAVRLSEPLSAGLTKP